MTSETDSWETVVDYPNYEINTEYPYSLRKKGSTVIKKEWLGNHGYYLCSLGNDCPLKHLIIANQWLPKEDGKPVIDHKDNDRTNNRLSNLRWVTYRENNLKMLSYGGKKAVYVDELPEGSTTLTHYNGHDLEGYSFDRDFNVYRVSYTRFRKLFIQNSGTSLYYNCYDVEDKRVKVCINKLKSGDYE